MQTLTVETEKSTNQGQRFTSIADRVARLRELMRGAGIDAYLVPSADPHNNEYVPECWKRRQFISGFTGSAGDVVITLDEAGLWTDGRYFLQAEEQLQGTGISLNKLGDSDVPSIGEWSADKLSGGVLGVDPKVLSIKTAEKLELELAATGSSIRYLESNLIDEIWDDQPDLVFSSLEVFPQANAGRSVAEKLQLVREKLAEQNCVAHLISSLDGIAWLFNMRGSDINYNRVFLSYAVITDQKAFLYIDPEQVTSEIEEHLDGLVEIKPYESIDGFLQDISEIDGQSRLWIDAKYTSKWLENQIGDTIKVFDKRSPVTDLKAAKNEVELQGFRDCHLLDGLAMVRFLKWLEEAVPAGGVTELSAAQKLEEFRATDPSFIGPSFPTISGYGAHGAIIHYEASPESDVELKPEGIFLLDSGGHYFSGTTDITRTLALGEPTAEHREVFTKVLQGVIGLTEIRFPKGSSGKQLELPARQPLWDSGRNFNHGTGHGVGHCLNVHEGPIGFSPKDPGVALELGNVVSNEPGYYMVDEYGMRIENLMIVCRDEELSMRGHGAFFYFETITMCPIELELIAKELLSSAEVAWLNAYHQMVYEQLADALDDEHKVWLQHKTRKI